MWLDNYEYIDEPVGTKKWLKKFLWIPTRFNKKEAYRWLTVAEIEYVLREVPSVLSFNGEVVVIERKLWIPERFILF